jgi:hypothetical protein
VLKISWKFLLAYLTTCLLSLIIIACIESIALSDESIALSDDDIPDVAEASDVMHEECIVNFIDSNTK